MAHTIPYDHVDGLVEIWMPTGDLRWVQDSAGVAAPGEPPSVLQQAWRDQQTGVVQWRDVPVVTRYETGSD